MSFKIEIDVYTLNELREIGGAPYQVATRQLSGRAQDLFWHFTHPEIVSAFQAEHSQPRLDAEVDVYWRTAKARGCLQVPVEMSERWAQEEGHSLAFIPVGEFQTIYGWASRIGGELYCWVPEDDGVALDEMLDFLLSTLTESLCNAFDAETSTEALHEFAESRGMLFDAAGNVWGNTEDLK